MDGVFIDKLDDLLVAQVVGDQVDIFRDTLWGIVLVLQERESGPLGVGLPKFENGFGSLQGASSGEMEKGVLFAGDCGVIEILRSESGEVGRGMDFAEDLKGVFAFAKDVIDLLEARDVTLRKTFLVWDEDVERSGFQPAHEDPFEENVRIEFLFRAKPLGEDGDASAVAHGDLVTGGGGDGMNEVNVTVQPNAIGARNDVKMGHG